MAAQDTVLEATPGEVPSAYQPLFSSVQGLFNSWDYSDVVVKCGEQTWPAHKAVVCAQSPFFKKAAVGEFKESKTGIIELFEDEPQVVHEMLRYLYTADYVEFADEHTSLQEDIHSTLVLNVHIATISDKYDIPGLGQLAAAKYKKRAAEEWGTNGFADSIEDLYNTATEIQREMRSFAVAVTAEHRHELMKAGTRFREVSKTVPCFADEVLEHLTSENRHAPGSDHYCEDCEVVFEVKVHYSHSNEARVLCICGAPHENEVRVACSCGNFADPPRHSRPDL